MKGIPENIFELLILYRKGQLSPEEYKELSAWLSLNKDAMKGANEFLRLSEHLNSVYAYRKINADRSWEKVEESTGEYPGWNQTKMTVRRRQIRIFTSVVAAVVLLGLLTYLGVILLQKPEMKPIAEVHIKPGRAHAELTLGDGVVVPLESGKDEVILDKGTFIENNSGVLAYTKPREEKQEISINQLKVPRGGEYELVLPDGTKVWINSESQLTYPVAFVGKERRVSLTGEAFFEVTPNKQLPFIVDVKDQEIRVLGTEFDISAYTDDAHIITTLVEGEVAVKNMDNKGGQEILHPNEQLVYFRNNHHTTVKTINVDEYVSWKDGMFVFRHRPLEHIMKKLGRWYDVEVCFVEEEAKHLVYAGDFSKENSLSDFLSALELEMSVKVEMSKNTVYISSK